MIRTLQSLRFVFVMLVVISHYNDAHFDFGGDCGVSFFFILSGFVLSLAYSDKISEGNFCSWSLLKRQWKKVYPLHIMTFLVMVLFDMRLGYHHSISALIANMLLMQSWIPSKEVYFMANGPSWFLCDIIFFYVVFSKLNHTLMKAGKKAIIVLYSIIITCYAFLMLTIPSELINPVLYVCPLVRLLDFSFGILLYRAYSSQLGIRLRQQAISHLSATQSTIIESFSVLTVIIIAFAYPFIPQRMATVSLFWIVIPVFILCSSISDKGKGLLSRFLQSRQMLWLGGLSFEVYLLHMPLLRIQNSLWNSLQLEQDTILHIFVFILLLILSSHSVKMASHIFRKK